MNVVGTARQARRLVVAAAASTATTSSPPTKTARPAEPVRVLAPWKPKVTC